MPWRYDTYYHSPLASSRLVSVVSTFEMTRKICVFFKSRLGQGCIQYNFLIYTILFLK